MKARIYVSKDNLKYNVDYIKSKIGNREIIAMVKANAYGAGEVLVASELQKIGIKNFGVANVDEAVKLRKANISGMILVTSVLLSDELKDAVENDISISVSSVESIKEVDNIAKECGKIATIHIKIDTGMTRLGFEGKELISRFEEIAELENIKIQGIYTHLSCADSDKEYTISQINEFKTIVSVITNIQPIEYIHILNSDGMEYYTDQVGIDTHVRVGLVLYGYTKNVRPVIKLTAPVLHITSTKKYTKVGYSGTYIAKPNTKIAVIKIGYADGISRSLSNNLTVYVNGVECEQVGNICMDMMMINVTDVDVNIGDEVVIWDYTNNLKEIAKSSNKIVYEVISNLGDRIERVLD